RLSRRPTNRGRPHCCWPCRSLGWGRMDRLSAIAVAAMGALTVCAGPAFGQTGAATELPPRWRWDLGATGETVFEHTRASLRDPHFGMRLYRDTQVPGTLHEVPDPTAADADALAAVSNGNHTFWDVAFGERMPLFSLYQVNPRRPRY